jgi:hypothetical protein
LRRGGWTARPGAQPFHPTRFSIFCPPMGFTMNGMPAMD